MTKRILLDESVPRHLAGPLEEAGFSVTSYPQAWKQTKNGELLTLAERQSFDILITSDKNIYAQQNLRGAKHLNCRFADQHSSCGNGAGHRCGGDR